MGVRFSAPIQTGAGAQPASCKMGTGSLSRLEKRPRRVVNHPPTFRVEVKEIVELHLDFPSGSLWSVVGRYSPFLYITCQSHLRDIVVLIVFDDTFFNYLP